MAIIRAEYNSDSKKVVASIDGIVIDNACNVNFYSDGEYSFAEICTNEEMNKVRKYTRYTADVKTEREEPVIDSKDILNALGIKGN